MLPPAGPQRLQDLQLRLEVEGQELCLLQQAQWRAVLQVQVQVQALAEAQVQPPHLWQLAEQPRRLGGAAHVACDWQALTGSGRGLCGGGQALLTQDGHAKRLAATPQVRVSRTGRWSLTSSSSCFFPLRSRSASKQAEERRQVYQ